MKKFLENFQLSESEYIEDGMITKLAVDQLNELSYVDQLKLIYMECKLIILAMDITIFDKQLDIISISLWI